MQLLRTMAKSTYLGFCIDITLMQRGFSPTDVKCEFWTENRLWVRCEGFHPGVFGILGAIRQTFDQHARSNIPTVTRITNHYKDARCSVLHRYAVAVLSTEASINRLNRLGCFVAFKNSIIQANYELRMIYDDSN